MKSLISTDVFSWHEMSYFILGTSALKDVIKLDRNKESEWRWEHFIM